MEAAFTSYQCGAFHVYRRRTSNATNDRNRTRAQQVEARGTQPKLWDGALRYYTKGWACTHIGQFKSRGKGLRTNYTTRRIQRRAKLNVLLFVDEGGSFHVRKELHDSTHNHTIDKNVLNPYVEKRKITSPATRSIVQIMGKVRCKQPQIDLVFMCS